MCPVRGIHTIVGNTIDQEEKRASPPGCQMLGEDLIAVPGETMYAALDFNCSGQFLCTVKAHFLFDSLYCLAKSMD